MPLLLLKFGVWSRVEAPQKSSGSIADHPDGTAISLGNCERKTSETLLQFLV